MRLRTVSLPSGARVSASAVALQKRPVRSAIAAGFALLCIAVGLLSGCATRTTVYSADATQQSGVLVLGYTTDAAVRRAMEMRLVEDLAQRGISGFPSHLDLPDLEGADAAAVRAVARDRKAMSLILLNRVAADASDSLLVDPARITPVHPDLQVFFAESRDEMVDRYGDETLAFVEVNLFLLDGDRAKLYWSGTSWSFRADGEGAAVSELSQIISDQLAQVRDRFGRAKTLAD